MITVQPLETSVRELAPSTLVYVIRGGWALAYRAEMLDDRANELYVVSAWPESAPGAAIPRLPHVWWYQLSADYVEATPELRPATYRACAGMHDFRVGVSRSLWAAR